MVDHDGDVALPLAERELVDPDPSQPLKRVTLTEPFVGDDPLDDPPDRVPADPHQLAHRGLGAVRRKPRHLLLERPGEPALMPRPAHPHDHDPVAAALDPGRLRLDERLRRPEIKRPPTPDSVPTVIAGRPTAAHPAPRRVPLPRPNPHDKRVVIDDDRLHNSTVHTHEPRQYPVPAHAATRLPTRANL